MTLRQQWESYRERVVLADSARAKNAFYAGAAALWDLVVNHLTPEAEPTEQDVAMMDRVHAELRAYKAWNAES